MIAVGIVSVTMMAQQAFALKNLFACITSATHNGKLTFDDYVKCFDSEFHGQLNGPAKSGDSVKA